MYRDIHILINMRTSQRTLHRQDTRHLTLTLALTLTLTLTLTQTQTLTLTLTLTPP